MDIFYKKQSNLETLKKSLPSSDPGFYQIKQHDFKRNSGTDRVYKINWLLPMLRVFDCRCAVCGDDSNGLELDHYFVPKVKGGSFVLNRIDGYAINNAVPMCTPCNRKKHDGSLTLSDDALVRLAFNNLDITNLLNNHSLKLGLIDADLSDIYQAKLSNDIFLRSSATLFENKQISELLLLKALNEFCFAIKPPFLSIKVEI